MSDRKQLPGKFVWFELVTPATARAQAFYGEVLGWKVQRFPVGPVEYEMIYAGDAMIGGYAPAASGQSPHWISCVSVPDVEAASAAAVAAGGKVVVPATQIPGVGQRARIADPQGAELCLLHSSAGDPADDGDTPVGRWLWNELHTPDPQGALAFYEKVVGFTHQSMDSGGGETYHVIGRGGVDRGGVTHHLPPGVAAHWLPYVRVTDVDATAARAAKQGGRIAMPGFDIPGIGRIAVLIDPAGAQLAIMRPDPRMK
jgi:predicted enzyme related to lactoylglutathione lyase